MIDLEQAEGHNIFYWKKKKIHDLTRFIPIYLIAYKWYEIL